MPERRPYRSSIPLSLGVALIGVGILALRFGPGAGGAPLLLGLGIGSVVVGIYQFADNVDRAARALIERR